MNTNPTLQGASRSTSERVSDTKEFPYCFAGRIVAGFEYPDRTFEKISSGFLLNPRTVVTATPNVIDIDSKTRASHVTFTPGYSNRSQPLGQYLAYPVAGPLDIYQGEYAFLTLIEDIDPHLFNYEWFDRILFPISSTFPLPPYSDASLYEIGYPNVLESGSDIDGEHMILTSNISVTSHISVPEEIGTADDPRKSIFSTNANLSRGSNGSIVYAKENNKIKLFGVHVHLSTEERMDFALTARFTPEATYMTNVAGRPYNVQLCHDPTKVLGNHRNMNGLTIPSTTQAKPEYDDNQIFTIVPFGGFDPETYPLASNFPFKFSLLNNAVGLALRCNRVENTHLTYGALYDLVSEPYQRDSLLSWVPNSEVYGGGFQVLSPAVDPEIYLTSGGLKEPLTLSYLRDNEVHKWRLLPAYFSIRISMDKNQTYALTPNAVNSSVVMWTFSKWDYRQQWRVVFAESDAFYIINRKTKQFLSWTGAQNSGSLSLADISHGPYSQWTVGATGNNRFAIRPRTNEDQNLDIPGANLQPGVEVWTYDWNRGANQQFYFCCFDTTDTYNLII